MISWPPGPEVRQRQLAIVLVLCAHPGHSHTQKKEARTAPRTHDAVMLLACGEAKKKMFFLSRLRSQRLNLRRPPWHPAQHGLAYGRVGGLATEILVDAHVALEDTGLRLAIPQERLPSWKLRLWQRAQFSYFLSQSGLIFICRCRKKCLEVNARGILGA